MKHILFLLLICSVASTAQAQTITAAQFRKSLDSVAALSRTADARQDTRLSALERNVVTLRPGTVDSLNRLSVLLTDLSTRIAQQGASLSSLNATVAGNVATDNAQAVAISNLQAAVKEALSAGVLAQDMINQMKQYLKAIQ